MGPALGTATIPLSEYHALRKDAERLRSIEKDETGEINRLLGVIDELNERMSLIISQNKTHSELMCVHIDSLAMQLDNARASLKKREEWADSDHDFQAKLKATLRVMYWVAVCLAGGWCVTTVVLIN